MPGTNEPYSIARNNTNWGIADTKIGEAETLAIEANRVTRRYADSAEMNADTGMRTGDIAITADTGVEFRYNGAAWKFWNFPMTSYTPSIAGVGVGNGTLDFKYGVTAGMLAVRGVFALGSTSTVTGLIEIAIPGGLTMAGLTGLQPIGQCNFYDSSPATFIPGMCTVGSGTNTVRVRPYNAANTYVYSFVSTNATTPFTWAVNDGVLINVLAELL